MIKVLNSNKTRMMRKRSCVFKIKKSKTKMKISRLISQVKSQKGSCLDKRDI